MSDDQLHTAIDAIRAQIQAQLEAQLNTLERQHEAAIESARQEERAAADERWADQLNRATSEWEARLQSALADGAAEAERRVQTEVERVRREAEHEKEQVSERAKQEAEASFERARVELDQALQAERSSHTAAQSAHTERIGNLEREIDETQKRAQALQNDLTVARAQQEQAVAAARESVEAESGRVRSLSGELTAAKEALERTRLAFDTERSAARQALEAERTAALAEAAARAGRERDAAEARVAERQSRLAVTERLLRSVHAISDARSLRDVLAVLVTCAAAEASRAAVLIQRDGLLQGVAVSGFDPTLAQANVEGSGVFETAMKEKQTVAVTPAAALAFASLPNDRAGLAVPIVVGGQAVAVLYADNGVAEPPEAPASWPEAVEILCCHASAVLSQLTAMRTAQAVRMMRPAAPEPQPQDEGLGEADQAARRYARLLVSEIKLYNEPAVRVGREKRDLLARLRPEVDRARRLYEQRVPISVAARSRYFDQELRETLAGGDASLLGDQAVLS